MAEFTIQVSADNRRFTRVVLSRTAKLISRTGIHEGVRVHNLSLGGLFLDGKYDVDCGDLCELEVHETGRHSCLILHFKVRVVRIESEGLALEFVDMPADSYRFLQTISCTPQMTLWGSPLNSWRIFPPLHRPAGNCLKTQRQTCELSFPPPEKIIFRVLADSGGNKIHALYINSGNLVPVRK